MWGQYDRSMPPDIMLPRWQKLIPQAETFIVTDSGHCPQDERPDILNPRLIQFVEQLVASKNSVSVTKL
jgi:pimeloyl-ACP methyl ester carboxylesterase